MNLPLPLKLTTEAIALFLIGDGVASMLQPRRHAALWRAGPLPLEKAGGYFETRPVLSALVGAAEIALGLWIAAKQQPSKLERLNGS